MEWIRGVMIKFTIAKVISLRGCDEEYVVSEPADNVWSMARWMQVGEIAVWCNEKFGVNWQFQWGGQWNYVFIFDYEEDAVLFMLTWDGFTV